MNIRQKDRSDGERERERESRDPTSERGEKKRAKIL